MEAAYAALRRAIDAESRAHDATVAAMVAAARAGWSCREIGAVFGVCSTTILWRLRGAGVLLGGPGGRGRGRSPYKAQRAIEMKGLAKTGWTLERIARKYGVTRQRVHQILCEPEVVYGSSGRAYRMDA
jgi:transposase